jgi:hypothetical protein
MKEIRLRINKYRILITNKRHAAGQHIIAKSTQNIHTKLKTLTRIPIGRPRIINRIPYQSYTLQNLIAYILNNILCNKSVSHLVSQKAHR